MDVQDIPHGKAVVLRANPDLPLETVEPATPGDWALAEMQLHVGGYIELVELPGTDYMMVIDEEGKLKNKPCNIVATALWYQTLGQVVADELVGDVLVTPSDWIK